MSGVGGPSSLEQKSASFAAELQTTLDLVLPGDRTIVATRASDSDHRFVVSPEGAQVSDRRLPLYVHGEHLANLAVSMYLDLDRTGKHLKTVKSDVIVHSKLDSKPLIRYEYLSTMTSSPIAHWHVHAERGALSHLLARAHEHHPGLVKAPHDMSSLHIPVGGERYRPCMEDVLPVGGERYRPCMEDVLQFLVADCGVDAVPDWEKAICEGCERWRLRQLATAIRDVPGETGRILAELGWTVTPPMQGQSTEQRQALRQW